MKDSGLVRIKLVICHIKIKDCVSSCPVIVPPSGYESADTFLQNHFYEMLRIFETELDKQQSVLFVIGFSFQDEHIGKMIKRAMQNPELMIYAFGYSENDKERFLNNLHLKEEKGNFVILLPSDFAKEFRTTNIDEYNKESYSFTLKNLTDVLKNISKDGVNDDKN